MHNDYHNAQWTVRHHELSDAIHKAVRIVAHGFIRLNARQFHAPWRETPTARKCEAGAPCA